MTIPETALPEHSDQPLESPTSTYWEIGGHPTFLLSVDEKVVDARERISQVADTSITVILSGERGVGKEALARGIHDLSSRSGGLFVSLNLYAIPKSAIEREMFDENTGKLNSVGDGTLYLHGIELLSDELELQLREWKREGTRNGSDKRVILSCEQPSLGQNELAGLERGWGVVGGAVCVEIPALRDRPEDIPLLANHILQKYGGFYGSKIRVLRNSFVKFLQGYRWPGNIRELERVIRRFLVIEDEEAIREELGAKKGPGGATDDELLESGLPLKEIASRAVARVESRAIEQALAAAKWNKKRAAANLEISYKTLLNKIKDYSIEA